MKKIIKKNNFKYLGIVRKKKRATISNLKKNQITDYVFKDKMTVKIQQALQVYKLEHFYLPGLLFSKR